MARRSDAIHLRARASCADFISPRTPRDFQVISMIEKDGEGVMLRATLGVLPPTFPPMPAAGSHKIAEPAESPLPGISRSISLNPAVPNPTRTMKTTRPTSLLSHPPRRSSLSIAAAVAAVLAGTHFAEAQTGAFTFSGNLGLGNSDALVGLLPTNTYLDAYNLGAATNVTINGVLFTGVGGTNPAVAGVFSTTGLGNGTSGGILPGGQLGTLTNNFVYGAAGAGGAVVPEVFTFSNVVVGQTYVVSFYNRAWDGAARNQNLSAGGASTGTVAIYDQNCISRWPGKSQHPALHLPGDLDDADRFVRGGDCRDDRSPVWLLARTDI